MARLLPAWRLTHHINQLEHPQLEANYYYALGEIMTIMAGRLRHEIVRQPLMFNLARSMLGSALLRRGDTISWDEPFVPLIRDLHSPTLAHPFLSLTTESLHMQPFSKQMLSRTLATITVERRREPRPESWRSLMLQERQFANMSRREETIVGPIALNAPIGASLVLGNFLIAETNNTIIWDDETMAQPIDLAAVKRVRRSPAFPAVARQRMDEFHRGDGWEFPEDGTGVYFNRGILADPPPPLDMNYINKDIHTFHEDRLICPAVEAGRLARDIARNILPGAIMVASQLVPAEEFPNGPDA